MKNNESVLSELKKEFKELDGKIKRLKKFLDSGCDEAKELFIVTQFHAMIIYADMLNARKNVLELSLKAEKKPAKKPTVKAEEKKCTCKCKTVEKKEPISKKKTLDKTAK